MKAACPGPSTASWGEGAGTGVLAGGPSAGAGVGGGRTLGAGAGAVPAGDFAAGTVGAGTGAVPVGDFAVRAGWTVGAGAGAVSVGESAAGLGMVGSGAGVGTLGKGPGSAGLDACPRAGLASSTKQNKKQRDVGDAAALCPCMCDDPLICCICMTSRDSGRAVFDTQSALMILSCL